jgi:hypothetical protein
VISREGQNFASIRRRCRLKVGGRAEADAARRAGDQRHLVLKRLCGRQTATLLATLFLPDYALVNPIMRAQGASREMPFGYEAHRGALCPVALGACECGRGGGDGRTGSTGKLHDESTGKLHDENPSKLIADYNASFFPHGKIEHRDLIRPARRIRYPALFKFF